MTLSLDWWEDYGAVRFTATAVPAGSTIYIIAPGDRLQTIRGYEDDSWHSAGGPGLGYSFEMPMGVVVRYGIAPVGSISWPGSGEQAAIFTPQNQAWLRDLYDPTLSQKVTVMSTGDENRPARQSVLRIAGRPKPVVLWDVREARQGTIILVIENDPDANPVLWRITEKDKIDTLLDTGRPLLLSLCQSKDFPPCYMAVTESTYVRLGKEAAWMLSLTYVEIDNPVDVAVMIPPEFTYADRLGAGDANLMTFNPSFETSPYAGLTGGSAVCETSTEWASDGLQSLKVTPNGTNNGSSAYPVGSQVSGLPAGSLSARLGVVPGETYTVTADLNVPVVQTGSIGALGRRLAIGTIIGGVQNNDWKHTDAAPNAVGITTLSMSFTVPLDATDVFLRLLNGSMNVAEPVYWDNIVITAAASYQDWVNDYSDYQDLAIGEGA